MATFNFEDGLVPSSFIQRTGQPWENSTVQSNGGTRSFSSSSTLGDNDMSWFAIYGDFQAGDFNVDYLIRSENNFDFGGIILQNGSTTTELVRVSGAGSWTAIPTQTLTAGIHLIFFYYIKDVGTSTSDDAFYIDNLILPDFVDLKPNIETFPSGVPVGWVNDSTHPWIQNSTVNGVQSLTGMPNNTSSTLTYTSPVSSPAGNIFCISFADSEENFDFGTIEIDDTQVSSDSGRFFDNQGESIRGPLGHSQAVTAGARKYEFIYSKDTGTVHGGDNFNVVLFADPSMLSPDGITGSGDLQSEDSILSGIGSAFTVITGSGDLESGDNILSGVGQRLITGTGDLQSGDSILSGIGAVGAIATGSGNLQSGDNILNGAGSAFTNITATGNLQSSDNILSGLGDAFTVIITSGNFQSSNNILNGLGTVGTAVIGDGNLQSGDNVLNGVGSRIAIGTGDLQSGDNALNGTGFRTIVGIGDLQSGDNILSGVGSAGNVVTGLGNLQSNNNVLSGIGASFTINLGTGNLQSENAILTGVGHRSVNGSGDLQSGNSILSGTGTSITVITGSGNLQSGDNILQGFQVALIVTPEERRATVSTSNRRSETFLNNRRVIVSTNIGRRMAVGG